MTNDLMVMRYLKVQNGKGFSVDKCLNDYFPSCEAYAVGGASDSVETEYNDDLSFNKFREIMELKIEFMKAQPDTTTQVIGAWVNDEGVAFIEVSDIVFDREEAIALGKERGEEAVWDFAKAESIYL
jgi:hypothetical protein